MNNEIVDNVYVTNPIRRNYYKKYNIYAEERQAAKTKQLRTLFVTHITAKTNTEHTAMSTSTIEGKYQYNKYIPVGNRIG